MRRQGGAVAMQFRLFRVHCSVERLQRVTDQRLAELCAQEKQNCTNQ